MKKVFSFVLIALLLCSFTVPVMAEDGVVAFTTDSSFTVGGTVKVDESKTIENIMGLDIESVEYNAASEGNVQYYWFRDDSYFADGTSVTLTEEDEECQLFCKVYLFSDTDRTQQCGAYDSVKFTVQNTENDTMPTEPDESTKTTGSEEQPTDGIENATESTEVDTDASNPTMDADEKNNGQNDKGMPWWGIMLIALVAAGVGAGITIVVLKKKK